MNNYVVAAGLIFFAFNASIWITRHDLICELREYDVNAWKKLGSPRPIWPYAWHILAITIYVFSKKTVHANERIARKCRYLRIAWPLVYVIWAAIILTIWVMYEFKM